MLHKKALKCSMTVRHVILKILEMRQISNQRQDRGKHIADVLEEKKEK